MPTPYLNQQHRLMEFDVQKQFEAIFKYANEGILIIDNQGVIQNINPSSERMFGYEQNELLNQPIELLLPHRFRQIHYQHRENYSLQLHPRSMGSGYDLWALKKSGEEFPVEVSLSPFNISGGTYIIAFVIDISERKKAEKKELDYRLELEEEVENRTLVLKEAIQKLEKTKADLDKSLKRERELNALKTKFVSIASHEFRTPLSTMLSSLSLIEKYNELNDTTKRDKHIERIKKSIRGLTEILNDILSVNKLEEGKVLVQPETFQLPAFLEECLADVAGLLKKGQQLTLHCQNDGSFTIHQDAKLLRHIILNLLSNAIKFSGEDKPIKLIAELQNNQLAIKVIDRGIGIPEKDQKQLFERFFRAENAGQIQGTGLGLSIVSHYTKLLNGDISYQSSEGQGSTFCLVLPRHWKIQDATF